MPNTLTIVGESDTISLYLNTYFSCLFLHYHPLRQGFEPFCICCTHVSKRNDKPTMPNTLTIVGGWNSDTISLYLNTYFSCLFLHYHPLRQGFEPFCICCTHVSKQNDKPTMPNTLTIVGGWNSDTISLYLNTYFSCLFLHYHPLRQGFEPFCICCTHVSKQNDKPTTPITFAIVGGWNSNTLSLYLFLSFTYFTVPPLSLSLSLSLSLPPEVTSDTDFNWLCQLRYYWEKDDCIARITNASVKYQYEYLGNTGRYCTHYIIALSTLHYGYVCMINPRCACTARVTVCLVCECVAPTD